MNEDIEEDDPRLNVFYDLQTFSDSDRNALSPCNIKFIDSIEKWLGMYGKISFKQLQVLEEIYEKVMTKESRALEDVHFFGGHYDH